MSMRQGIIGAVAVLIASAVQSFAIQGLELSVQCTNVVLTWPSMDGSGDSYIIRRRLDLSTNSTWTVVTNYYPAATGTNITTFIDYGVVTNANCDGSSGGEYATAALGGSRLMAARVGGIATIGQVSATPLIPPPLPPLPPGLGYSQTNGGATTLTSVPMTGVRSFVMAATSGSSSGFGSPTPAGVGSATNNSPTQAAFYEVVKVGATLYGLTNGAIISGRLTLPLEVANNVGQLTTLTLEDSGSPIASSIHAAPFELPVPLAMLDTTQMSNGVHNISVYAAWFDPGTGVSEDGSSSVIEMHSPVVSVTVSNEISFPNWMPEFGELGNSIYIAATSAHTNA